MVRGRIAVEGRLELAQLHQLFSALNAVVEMALGYQAIYVVYLVVDIRGHLLWCEVGRFAFNRGFQIRPQRHECLSQSLDAAHLFTARRTAGQVISDGEEFSRS
jgi:hypothetical protein